ncbi:MAG: phosphopantothenoylcysteine decarboxylase, partial [Thermoplasmatota archaeon]
APKTVLVAFKAESDSKALLTKAKDRLKRHKAQFVVANLAASFGAEATEAYLVSAGKTQAFSGPKAVVLPQVVAAVAAAGAGKQRKGRA